ncbi:MAG: hypothetical protein V4557_05450 [Bacteroidota bacterium]
MRDVKKLISEIIPPADYTHRNGFTNEFKIDSLNANERCEVEKGLLILLKKSSDDLVVNTLAYMKSVDSIPILKTRLSSTTKPINKIHLAKAIFKIDPNQAAMKDIAFEEFEKISEEFELIGSFHLLIHFQDDQINTLIQKYIDDKRYLVAYNARTSLGIDTRELIEREQSSRLPKKAWWKIWQV